MEKKRSKWEKTTTASVKMKYLIKLYVFVCALLNWVKKEANQVKYMAEQVNELQKKRADCYVSALCLWCGFFFSFIFLFFIFISFIINFFFRCFFGLIFKKTHKKWMR